MASPGACELEAAPRDPLDLVRPVLHRVEDGAVVADAAGAVVEAADELADDEKVDAVAARRPQVRVDVELAAQADEALLGPHGPAVELGCADRAHEDGVGLPGGRQRLRWEGIAGRMDRGAAEEMLLQLEIERELGQDAGRCGRDLRPDPVAGKEDDPHRWARVTAPSEAEETSAAYLASTPFV